MFVNIVDDLNKFMKPVQQFINKNYGNPLLWIAIVGIVMGAFSLAYYALHRGE